MAEDNDADVDLVREAFREHNIDCELTVAHDGANASEYIDDVAAGRRPPPDMFLLDLNLPQTDGHELFASIRICPLCVDAPVIVLTSSDAPRDRDRARALGASVYFRKPSDLLEFLQLGAIVSQLIDGRRSQPRP
jgi:CheY-like chemotaxis protein